MDDTIKRSDAINAVTAYLNLRCVTEARFHKDGKSYNRQIAEELLKVVPTVEPTVDKDYLIELIQGAVYDGEDCARLMKMIEPKQGEWIDKGWHGDWQFETDGRGNCWHEYECSECGFHNKGSKSNFCPDCGVRMKGADHERL